MARFRALTLVALLFLTAACGGESDERVQPLPEETETPVAAEVEAGLEASDEQTDDDVAQATTSEDAEAPLPLWRPPALGYNARQGQALFDHYCATCHGDLGRGDGFNSYSLDPKPRDLTDPELQADRSDEELAAVIRSGGGAAGLSTGMPPWGRTLTELQIRNLVVFVRVLPELAETDDG